MSVSIGEILAVLKTDVSSVTFGTQKARRDFEALATATEAVAARIRKSVTAAADAVTLYDWAGRPIKNFEEMARAGEAAANRLKQAHEAAARSIYQAYQHAIPAATRSMEDAIRASLPETPLGIAPYGTSTNVVGGGDRPPVLTARDPLTGALRPGSLPSFAFDPLSNRQGLTDPQAAAIRAASQAAREADVLADVLVASRQRLLPRIAGGVDESKLKTGTAASESQLRAFGAAMSDVTGKAHTMNDALWQNRNAAFNLGMGLSSLGDVFGRSGQQMATTAIIALSLDAATAGLVTGIVTATAIFAAYALSVNEAATSQAQANIAVRALDMGPLRSQIQQATADIDWFNESVKRGGLSQMGAEAWAFGKTAMAFFGGQETAPDLRKRRQEEALTNIQPILDRKMTADATSALREAEIATEKFNESVALQANNLNAANRALDNQKKLLLDTTREKLAAAGAQYRLDKAELEETYRGIPRSDPRSYAAFKALEDAYTSTTGKITESWKMLDEQIDLERFKNVADTTARFAQENAAVAASYDQALRAASAFNSQLAMEAANFAEAQRYHEAEIRLLRAERDEKIAAAVAEAKPGIDRAQRWGETKEVTRLQENLGKVIADITVKYNDMGRASERAYERSRIAMRSFLLEQNLQRVQIASKLAEGSMDLEANMASPPRIATASSRSSREAGLGVAGLEAVQAGQFRARLALLDQERRAERQLYEQKMADLQSATFRDEQAIQSLKTQHEQAQADLMLREKELYAQRYMQAKEHWDRRIELEVRAQEALIKAVDATRKAEFSALTDGLAVLGQSVEAASITARAAAEAASADYAEALRKIDEQVRQGQLDDARAAQMRVLAQQEASAKVVSIRVGEVKELQKIALDLASVEDSLRDIPGAPSLGAGLRSVETLRGNIARTSQSLQAANELGVLSPSEAREAARRYADAFGRAIDRERAKFASRGFGQPGEPGIEKLFDSLKSDLRGGLDKAAQSSGAFGKAMERIRSDVSALNDTVADGSRKWQTMIDQFAAQIPASAAMAQSALASLKTEVANLRAEFDRLQGAISSVTAAAPGAGGPAGAGVGRSSGGVVDWTVNLPPQTYESNTGYYESAVYDRPSSVNLGFFPTSGGAQSMPIDEDW